VAGKKRSEKSKISRSAKACLKKKNEDYPIKSCTEECKYRRVEGEGCQYFKKGDVKEGSLCILDLISLKEWIEAYEGGDKGIIKKNAGAIQGVLVCKIRDILDKIDKEGMALMTPKVSVKGNVVTFVENGVEKIVYEYKEHPLWRRLVDLVKLLGVSPADFGLVEQKSQKVKGFIGSVEQLNLQVVMEKQQQELQQFSSALLNAKNLREQDPVYQRFNDNGS